MTAQPPNTQHRIYVASSWRNGHQPEVVQALRNDGHEVYDFKNPGPQEQGFSWKEIGDRATWTAHQFANEVLDHPISAHGFELDMRALNACSICVLVLPCGRSAHLELGQAVGRGKLTIVYMRELEEPELMYRMCDYIVTSLNAVRLACSVHRPRPRWQRDLADYDARRIHGGNEFAGSLPCALTQTRYRTPEEETRDVTHNGGPLPERGPCREYHHRACQVCGGCWRHGACTCDPVLMFPNESP